MSRRGENIYKRKDGRWEGRVLKQNGKYQSFYAKTYKEVKDKMRESRDDHSCYSKQSVGRTRNAAALFEAWLKGEVFLRVKPSTYDSYYRCIYKHIIPFFKSPDNDHITSSSVMRFVKAITQNTALAQASKKKIFCILRTALKDILKDGPEFHLIIKPIRLSKSENKEVQVFSLNEQRIIEAAALQSQDSRAIGIILCFYTGIRLGELCALKWSDIDMEAGTMIISRTVYRTKNFELGKSKTMLLEGTPKSRKSVRKIPLPEFLLKLASESGLCHTHKNCYVFSGRNTPFDPRRFQMLFKKILRDANLQHRKFHAIRHTFATRALELGVDIKTLSEILGHSNVSITLNIYAHSLLEHKKAAIEKFNDMYAMNMANSSSAVTPAVQAACNSR